MVSQVKKTGVRPSWITETVWAMMLDHWATDAAKTRSTVASSSRNSSRDGLGPHKHRSGQKSYLRVQKDLESEYGRPVSIGEVFIKTHTTSDGTYIDLKAKQIAENYEKNVGIKLSQLEEPSEVSDNASRVSDLTPEEKNQIFLQSTIPDQRGREYGLGSLHAIYSGSKKKGGLGSSTSSFITTQQQMQSQIEDQAKQLSEAQNRINSLEMVLSYMRKNDPGFEAFLDSRNSGATTEAPPTVPSSPSPNE